MSDNGYSDDNEFVQDNKPVRPDNNANRPKHQRIDRLVQQNP